MGCECKNMQNMFFFGGNSKQQWVYQLSRLPKHPAHYCTIKWCSCIPPIAVSADVMGLAYHAIILAERACCCTGRNSLYGKEWSSHHEQGIPCSEFVPHNPSVDMFDLLYPKHQVPTSCLGVPTRTCKQRTPTFIILPTIFKLASKMRHSQFQESIPN